MNILTESEEFDFDRLKKDLAELGLPDDFSICICKPQKTCWGRYYVGYKTIKNYVFGLSYEQAFPHILHEVIHHYQHWHQTNFRRTYGTMHDAMFTAIYTSKINLWQKMNGLEVSV